jgi:hypothetical protein
LLTPKLRDLLSGSEPTASAGQTGMPGPYVAEPAKNNFLFHSCKCQVSKMSTSIKELHLTLSGISWLLFELHSQEIFGGKFLPAFEVYVEILYTLFIHEKNQGLTT